MQGDERVGLVTYRLDGDDCELMTINSMKEGSGVGTALIEAVQTGLPLKKAVNVCG